MKTTASKQNLSDVLESFPHIRLASESDGRKLSDFAKSQFMKVKDFGIGFDRGEDFFALFKSYTNEYWVFEVHSDEGILVGMGSLTRFKARVKGEIKQIGYTGDLRFDAKTSREIRKEWRAFYSALVTHLEDENSLEHCDHLITAVFQENLHALGVFSKGLQGLVYHELCSYWNLSVFNTFLAKSNQLVVDSVATLPAVARPSLAFTETPTGKSFEPVVVRQGDKIHLGGLLWDGRLARVLRVSNLPLGLKLGFKILSRFSPVKYSESEGWTIKSLSCLAWEPNLSHQEKVDALAAAIFFAFRKGPQDFQILNVTLMDKALCRDLHRKFKLSKTSAGFLFEVTSADRKPLLRGEELVFEGAFM